MLIKFTGGLVVVLLILPLAAAFSGVAEAQDEWGMTRKISFVAAVDPPNMILGARENLYPKSVALDARVIFVTDRKIPGLEERVSLGGSLVSNLDGITKLIEGLRKELPSHQKTLEKYWGTKLKLKGEIWNFKGAASQLRSKGFTKGNSRVVPLNGKRYRLTRWAQRTEAAQRAIATATAKTVLKSQPKVDSKTNMFSAKFKSAGKPQFKLINVVFSPNKAELKNLYNEFKARFTKRVKRVRTFLNRKRKILRKSQMKKVMSAPAFQRFQFKRQTSFPWYGQRKIMKVRVSVTPGKRNIKYVDRPLGEPAFD